MRGLADREPLRVTTSSIAGKYHCLFILTVVATWVLENCVGIDLLQTELLSDGFFLALHRLQSAQIENQVPSFVRFDVVGERRHRSAIQTGHEYAIEIAIGRATLELRLIMEIEGLDGTILIVLQRVGRRSVAAAFDSM